VAAAAGEGGRSLSITSTRTAGSRGTARPSSWASQAGIEEVEPRAGDQALPLVCRPGLELHTGVAGLSRGRHGNLRSDGGQAVLSRALAQGGRSIDAVWFGLDRLPAVGGLAARYGDRAEQGCPSPRRRFAICGWTGPVESDTPDRRQLAAASAADRVSAGRGLRRSLLTPLAGSHQFCPLAASRRGCEQCEASSRTAGKGDHRRTRLCPGPPARPR
jgi:hypothetical protein